LRSKLLPQDKNHQIFKPPRRRLPLRRPLLRRPLLRKHLLRSNPLKLNLKLLRNPQSSIRPQLKNNSNNLLRMINKFPSKLIWVWTPLKNSKCNKTCKTISSNPPMNNNSKSMTNNNRSKCNNNSSNNKTTTIQLKLMSSSCPISLRLKLD